MSTDALKTMNLDDLGIATGIDINKLKQKFEDEKNINKNKGNGDKRFLKMPDGKTKIRILPPYKKDVAEFYKDFLVHNINGLSITCLRSRKFAPIDGCPICQITKYLYSLNSEPDRALGGIIRARPRYYYNVVVRDYQPAKPEDCQKNGFDLTVNPTEVKILSTGSKLYEKIKDYIFNSEYGDITHILNGYDFVIVKNSKKIENGKFIPNYDNSYPSKDSSPLAKDPETIKKIISGMHNLSDVVEKSKMEYADLINFLVKYFQEIEHEGVLNLIKDGFKMKIGYKSNFVPNNTNQSQNSVNKTNSSTQTRASIEEQVEQEKETVSTGGLDDFEKELLDKEDDGSNVPF